MRSGHAGARVEQKQLQYDLRFLSPQMISRVAGK
jgi:hypothetical protein